MLRMTVTSKNPTSLPQMVLTWTLPFLELRIRLDHSCPQRSTPCCLFWVLGIPYLAVFLNVGIFTSTTILTLFRYFSAMCHDPKPSVNGYQPSYVFTIILKQRTVPLCAAAFTSNFVLLPVGGYPSWFTSLPLVVSHEFDQLTASLKC